MEHKNPRKQGRSSGNTNSAVKQPSFSAIKDSNYKIMQEINILSPQRKPRSPVMSPLRRPRAKLQTLCPISTNAEEDGYVRLPDILVSGVRYF